MARIDRFERDGLRFPVRDEGPADGAPVVLLHGFPQDAGAFDEVLPALHARGLRTMVPTQRGYAATARPSERRAYRTSETVADVLALLDAAEVERAHVVGHDWGGSQAWALGSWHPARLASLTVLSTPHPNALAAALTTSTQGLRLWYMGFFQLPAAPEAVVPLRLEKLLTGSRLPPAYAQRYVRAMSEPGALTGALNWYRGIPFSAEPTVGKIAVPTTYLWGRHDVALGRAAAERTADWVTGSYEFVELEAGHWLPETTPNAVAGAVLSHVRD